MTTGSGAGTEIDTLSGIEFIEHGGGRFVLIDPSITSGVSFRQRGGGRRRCRDAARRHLCVRRGAHRSNHIDTNEDLDFTIPYDVPTDVHVTGTGTRMSPPAPATTSSSPAPATTRSIPATATTSSRPAAATTTIVGGQGSGDDIYDGGPGSNTVSYPSATNSITIDLKAADRSEQATLGRRRIGALLIAAALSCG